MGYQIRDLKRERAYKVYGEVKTWKMSPEELEDYRARTGYKEPRNSDGERIRQSVHPGSVRPNSVEQVRRVKMRKTAKEPDKQKFLELISAG